MTDNADMSSAKPEPQSTNEGPVTWDMGAVGDAARPDDTTASLNDLTANLTKLATTLKDVNERAEHTRGQERDPSLYDGETVVHRFAQGLTPRGRFMVDLVERPDHSRDRSDRYHGARIVLFRDGREKPLRIDLPLPILRIVGTALIQMDFEVQRLGRPARKETAR